MQFGQLVIDPAVNPAVLDTATWDPANAEAILKAQDSQYWASLHEAATKGVPLPRTEGVTPHRASLVRREGGTCCLATLSDGQQLLLGFGPGVSDTHLGVPLAQLALQDQDQLYAHRADLEIVARYMEQIDPSKAPRVMGPEPRLGLGSRMTTASWPGVYQAMRDRGFAANAIQNSMREANLLEDLLAGRSAELNYGPNLGTFASGHAGSSFEGLWLWGVLEALKAEGPLRYGADADHIQVKRGAGGLDRALRVLESVRHYTLYTVDVSDILDYGALDAGPVTAAEYLERKLPRADRRRAILAYHREPQRLVGRTLRLDEGWIGRFVAKYWDALDAMDTLTERIRQLKGGGPFDLEFAVDEVPAGVRACDRITSHEELLFIVRECRRRDLPVTHVAPNFGIEKEVDYRCPDGLPGLEARVHYQTEMARTFDLMLDFHSGDDLSAATRRAIGRATRGYSQFKVSPSLQLLFAEVLYDVHPEVFQTWWEDTLAFARREAAQGSSLAIEGLREFSAQEDPRPGPGYSVFRHYCFASVGRRNEQGQFVHREMFYGLKPVFYREYTDRLVAFLGEIADDLFGQG